MANKLYVFTEVVAVVVVVVVVVKTSVCWQRTAALRGCVSFCCKNAILKTDCYVLIAEFHFDIEVRCLSVLFCLCVQCVSTKTLNSQ